MVRVKESSRLVQLGNAFGEDVQGEQHSYPRLCRIGFHPLNEINKHWLGRLIRCNVSDHLVFYH